MSTAPLPATAAGSPGWSIPVWIPLGAAVGLTIGLFGASLTNLVGLWDRDPNYSHGYLVLPISLFLGYRIFRRVGAPIRGEISMGLIAILFGVLCQLAVTIVRWPPLSYLGLICVLRGLLVCAGGRKWARYFTFPLLFLFFMFPVPITWTSYAALWLQDMVAKISETVLSLFVICHRVGHSIRIAGVDKSLVVAEECSGLGQIVSFLAFGALLGHLLARPMWHRALLLFGAIPIAIAANTLRVTLMNLGAYYFGTKWLTGTLHDLPALFSIPIGVVFFLFLDRVLSQFSEQSPNPDTTADAAEAVQATPVLTTEQTPPGRETPGRGLFAGAMLLALGLVAQLGLTNHLRASGELSYPPLAGPFDSLPLSFNDPKTGQLAWRGGNMNEARDATRAKLPFQADDLLFRAYQNIDGAQIQVYMVHSRAGEDRKHHPEICIRDVSGAPEDVAFRKQVPIRADGSASAQRFRFQTGIGRAVVVYYWHYTPRPIDDPNRTQLQSLHQRIGVAAPSITVQVTVPIDEPKTLAAVEGQFLPALDAAARQLVLPPDTETGCHRLPIALIR